MIHKDKIFVVTQKIGIEKSPSKGNVVEGKLYKRDQVHFKDTKYSYLISCEIDEVNLRRINNNNGFKGVLKLGGESRTAAYEKYENKYLNQEKNQYINKYLNEIEECYKDEKFNSYKILFTSPYLWDEQCKNNHLVEKESLNKYGIMRNRSFVYGKKTKTGFYDMLNGKTKTMNCIPEGAVFSFSLVNKTSYKDVREEVQKILNEQSENTYKGFNNFILIGEEK